MSAAAPESGGAAVDPAQFGGAAVDPAEFGGAAAEAGTVHLVGGGPGDPGLLTLRAARLLATATVVAHDRLAPVEALAQCRADARLVYVGKQPDRHALSQNEINELLVREAKAGEAVVRFKGGDPFVFGRGSEEAQACLDAGVPFEVVPGITSAIAGPAYAGVPVTHRGVAPAFAVVTGHEDPTKDDTQVDHDALAAFPGTLVLLMGVGRIRRIAEALVAAGRPGTTPVAVTQWASTPAQRSIVATLDTVADRIAQAGLSSPAVIVVGDVAALRPQLAWFDGDAEWVRRRRPLHGRTVLVPRTRQQASELSARLRALGAAVVEAPTIAIDAPEDPTPLRDALTTVAREGFDWLAVTSANAADAVWAHVCGLGSDARMFAGVRVAAVGAATAGALRGHGLEPDLVPDTFTGRALGAALVAGHPPGRVLLPRADIATAALPDLLRDAGWDVTEVTAYRTVAVDHLDPGVADRLRAGAIDVVAFASSSTVRNLVRLLGGPPHPSVAVAAIGPVTGDTCRQLGLDVSAEADPHDLDGLVDAVVAAASARS